MIVIPLLSWISQISRSFLQIFLFFCKGYSWSFQICRIWQIPKKSHFSSVFQFYTPRKQQKTKGLLVNKRNIGLKWVKEIFAKLKTLHENAEKFFIIRKFWHRGVYQIWCWMLDQGPRYQSKSKQTVFVSGFFIKPIPI